MNKCFFFEWNLINNFEERICYDKVIQWAVSLEQQQLKTMGRWMIAIFIQISFLKNISAEFQCWKWICVNAGNQLEVENDLKLDCKK